MVIERRGNGDSCTGNVGLLIFAVLIAIDAFCLKLVLKITANDAPMRDCELIVSIAWVLEIILRLVLGAFSGVLCGWIVFFILLKKISDADFYPDCFLIALLISTLRLILTIALRSLIS